MVLGLMGKAGDSHVGSSSVPSLCHMSTPLIKQEQPRPNFRVTFTLGGS